MNEVDPIPAAVNISLLDSTVILTAVVLAALINPLEAVTIPVILEFPTTVNGVEMLQFDVNAAIPQEGIADTAKLVARAQALNRTIENDAGIISADMLAVLNAEYAGQGQNVQMALVEVGESDPLSEVKQSNGNYLSFTSNNKKRGWVYVSSYI